MNSYKEKLSNYIKKNNSNLCIGIDIDKQFLPKNSSLKNLIEYSFSVVDQTREFCVAYKPNLAFFEEWGSEGFIWLEKLLEHIGDQHIIICDAKRGDIGNTAKHYANAYFETFGFDAITLNPFLGSDSLLPFLQFPNKGIYVLCQTSNKSAPQLQQNTSSKVIEICEELDNNNIGLVVGATNSKGMKSIRTKTKLPFLIPGIGAQGGNLQEIISINKEFKFETIINVSRAIIFSESISSTAEQYNNMINEFYEN